MSQCLPNPALRGAALGQCHLSLALIERTMSRLALLQGYFASAARHDLCGPASGVESVLAGAWTDLRDVRNRLSGLAGQKEADHV